MTENSAESTRRSDADAAHESVMSDVSDVLLNIEHALSRAKKARATAAKYDEEVNSKLALDEAVTSLEKTRKRLMQDAYYRQDALRLI